MKSLTNQRIFISVSISLLLFCSHVVVAQCSVNAGPDIARCLNQSAALGGGLTFTGQAPVSFNWSGTVNDIQNPVFTATAAMAGTYTITITDANGCTASDDIMLTVNPLPIVNAGADVSICPGTPTNICATASSANGAISYYIWMAGPLTQCRTVSPLTTPSPYSVTVTDALGCQATDAVQVTVLPTPGANAGADQTICLGNGPVQLTGNPAGGVWTGTGVSSTGLFTPSAVGSTTLTYTTTGANSCTSTDQVVITVTNPNPPSGGVDVAVCVNTPPFQLPAVGSWNGSTWVTSGGVFTPNAVGTYNLFVTTTSGGCNASDLVVVQVLPSPTVDAGTDTAICTGNSMSLNATATSANGPINGIAWTGGWVSAAGILNPTITPSTSTTYTLNVTDQAGCLGTDAVTISVNAFPTVNAGADQTLCANAGPVQLTGATPAGGTWTGSGVTGAGLFSQTTIGQYSLVYTFANAAGCEGSDTRVITVIEPTPVDAGEDLILCQGGPTVMLQQGGTWSGSAFVQANGVFNPSTAGQYTLTYTALAGGCTSSDQLVIDVIPLPLVNAGSDASICANQNYSLNATASSANGAIQNIQWTGLNLASDDILNPLVSPTATATYEITATDIAGCSATDQITITVNPLPTVDAGVDVLLCSNAGASTLSGQSPAGGVWSGPQVNASGVFTPALDGDYTLTYVYNAPSGCSSYDTRVVTVISPNAVNAGPDITVCEDTPAFNLLSGGTWSGSTYIAGGNSFNPTQPGSYNLTYTTTSNGCNITDQVNITVLATPNANAGNDVSACMGSVVNLSGSTSTSPNGAITSYAWSNSTSGVSVPLTVSANATITLTITDAAGCTDSDPVAITAMALPTVSAGADVTLCNQPSPYTLTGNAPAGGTWSGPGVTSNGIFTPSAIGTFELNYCVTGANGCQACDALSVFVNAAPGNNAGADVQICQNSAPLQLTPLTAGGTWTGSGVTSTGLYTPGSPNNYILTYTIGSGFCQVTDNIVVTVHANPVANINPIYQVCESQVATLSASATGGLSPYTYSWSSSDPEATEDETGSINQVEPSADLDMTVQVADARGCTATAVTHVDVLAWPEASFDLPATACQNVNIFPTNTSQNATAYAWSFGNSETSSMASPTIDFNLQGVYQVELTASNALGCSHTTMRSIEIMAAPVASFTVNEMEGCSPFAVTVENNSTGMNLSHQWLIEGSFSTAIEPSNIEFETTEVTTIQPISLTVTNQCGSDNETIEVTVKPQPIAMFATDLSSQCSPVTTQYLNLSAGNPTSYFWDLGDSQTTTNTTPETNVYVTEDASADFTIRLFAQNECGVDSTTSVVHVLPNTVQIDLQPSVTSGCSPLMVQFTNNTTGATHFEFDFDTNEFSTAQSPNYVFENAGEYVVHMNADDGCSFGSTEVTITVSPSPTLAIGSNMPAGCPGSTIIFDQSSTGNITNMEWNFGDGSLSTDEQPAHTYTTQSSYVVSATVYDLNGCTANAQMPITIHDLPVPIIQLQNIEACSPWQVCPENPSVNAESFAWDNGMGGSSTDELPCFTYINGTEDMLERTITLTATSAFGCTASTSQIIHVLPQPELVMALSSNESCAILQPVETQVFANAADNFQWFVNDVADQQVMQPTFAFDAIGTYEINLVVSNTFGCTNESTSLYEIHPLPEIDIMPEVMAGCPPLAVNFDNTTINGANYAWVFSNGSTSNEMFPTQVFEHTGMYDVQIQATSADGCVSSQFFDDMIEVYPLPTAQFNFDPNGEIIYELDVQFTNQSQGAVQYEWAFDDGTYSTLANPTHEFATGGFYSVTLTAQNEFSCIDKQTLGVNIDNTFYTYMPNAFTPDGDGINDAFGPVFSSTDEIKKYRFYVKNKWGDIIFDTPDPNIKWLGSPNNEGYYVHTDMFTWVIEIEFNNKTLNRNLDGTVTVLR